MEGTDLQAPVAGLVGSKVNKARLLQARPQVRVSGAGSWMRETMPLAATNHTTFSESTNIDASRGFDLYPQLYFAQH